MDSKRAKRPSESLSCVELRELANLEKDLEGMLDTKITLQKMLDDDKKVLDSANTGYSDSQSSLLHSIQTAARDGRLYLPKLLDFLDGIDKAKATFSKELDELLSLETLRDPSKLGINEIAIQNLTIDPNKPKTEIQIAQEMLLSREQLKAKMLSDFEKPIPDAIKKAACDFGYAVKSKMQDQIAELFKKEKIYAPDVENMKKSLKAEEARYQASIKRLSSIDGVPEAKKLALPDIDCVQKEFKKNAQLRLMATEQSADVARLGKMVAAISIQINEKIIEAQEHEVTDYATPLGNKKSKLLGVLAADMKHAAQCLYEKTPNIIKCNQELKSSIDTAFDSLKTAVKTSSSSKFFKKLGDPGTTGRFLNTIKSEVEMINSQLENAIALEARLKKAKGVAAPSQAAAAADYGDHKHDVPPAAKPPTPK